jgi:hypothetical protein
VNSVQENAGTEAVTKLCLSAIVPAFPFSLLFSCFYSFSQPGKYQYLRKYASLFIDSKSSHCKRQQYNDQARANKNGTSNHLFFEPTLLRYLYGPVYHRTCWITEIPNGRFFKKSAAYPINAFSMIWFTEKSCACK